MPRAPERRWPGQFIAYATLVGIVSLLTVPVYLGAEPRHRPAVVRVSAALIAAVLLRRMLRIAKDRVEAGASSAMDRALHGPRRVASLDPSFVKLRDEVRFSTTNQRYFERVLWPRLRRLRAGSASGVAETMGKPPGRRFWGRGPALATLADCVAALERQR